MSQTRTASASATYTVADIEKVVRCVKADLAMIGDSTGAWTPQQAADRAHDIEILAKGGYLKHVDVTLMSAGVEVKAARYDVNTEAGGLTSSRPGGVLWPKVHAPSLRVVLVYTSAYTDVVEASLKSKFKVSWGPSSADTNHSSLKSAGGRDYASQAYGMQRKDWAA